MKKRTIKVTYEVKTENGWETFTKELSVKSLPDIQMLSKRLSSEHSAQVQVKEIVETTDFEHIVEDHF